MPKTRHPAQRGGKIASNVQFATRRNALGGGGLIFVNIVFQIVFLSGTHSIIADWRARFVAARAFSRDTALAALSFNALVVFLDFIMHLLFVCTGNTCRSPLAEAAWRAFGAPEITATSAGLAATFGLAVAPHSARVAQNWSEDLSKHKARRLTDNLARNADYLVCMTREQAQVLQRRFPHKKVLQLGTFSAPEAVETTKTDSVADELHRLWGSDSGDILDPIGGSLEAYEECGAHIKRAVIGLCEALRQGRV